MRNKMRKISLERAAFEGAKETAAVALVSVGIQLVQQPPYWPGALCIVGGLVLFIVDKVIE